MARGPQLPQISPLFCFGRGASVGWTGPGDALDEDHAIDVTGRRRGELGPAAVSPGLLQGL